MNARTNSTAVMARRVEPADSLDFFPTPPWATRAFCEHVLPKFEPATAPGLQPGGLLTAWDPACGEGHMALALEPYFYAVYASDIFDYGFGSVADFLHPDAVSPFTVDWIFMNPPFNQAAEFVKRALTIARRGVAMLVRMQFLEGEDRFAEIFTPHRPAGIFQFAERVPMHRGRWVVNGKSATAYTWVVWTVPKAQRLDWPTPATTFDWIPKSRRALSRHDDWLTFSGCMDVPKDHAAMVLADKAKAYQTPVVTLAQVRAEAAERARQPATISDIREKMERLL
jgi:hypothetical protein